MENRYQNIEEVIARVVCGEGTPQDLALVEEWTALSDLNAKAFEQSKKLVALSSDLHPDLPIDVDKAWQRVKSELDNPRSASPVISTSRIRRSQPLLRLAAILVVAAGLGTAVYFLSRPLAPVYDVVLAATDSVKKEILPDGSSIALNRNSILRYSSRNFGKERKVKLTGEAYFDVVHDENNAFVVEAGGLTIEDVGTSFDVKAFPDDKLVIVAVASGEVRVLAGDTGLINLVAGETMEFNKATGGSKKGSNDKVNVAPYKDKILIFENTELRVVIKLLNDVYSKNITLQNEEINGCRLTATFNNETLDSILEIISETLNLKIIHTENGIQLSGNGCK